MVPVGPLLTLIAERPERVRVYTPPARPAAMARIVKGIMDWLTDEPTIEAGMVEELARAIEKCEDREEVRDLSVQLRDFALRYRPNAARVALTEDEARVLQTMSACSSE